LTRRPGRKRGPCTEEGEKKRPGKKGCAYKKMGLLRKEKKRGGGDPFARPATGNRQGARTRPEKSWEKEKGTLDGKR